MSEDVDVDVHVVVASETVGVYRRGMLVFTRFVMLLRSSFSDTRRIVSIIFGEVLSSRGCSAQGVVPS